MSIYVLHSGALSKSLCLLFSVKLAFKLIFLRKRGGIFSMENSPRKRLPESGIPNASVPMVFNVPMPKLVWHMSTVLRPTS